MENFVKKVYRNMSYDCHKRLSNYLKKYGLYIIWGSGVIAMVNSKPSYELLGIGSVVSLSYVLDTVLNGEEYVKEVEDIRSLYDEFLFEYYKLNSDFEFNDPVEIYALYTCLLSNGYFSTGKNFEAIDNYDVTTYDISKINGAKLMTGTGESQHITKLFSDILDLNNINNVILNAFKGTCSSFINLTIEEIQELKSKLNGDLIHDETVKYLYYQELGEKGRLEIINDPDTYLKKSKSNFSVNLIKFNNVAYCFDPTNFYNYKPSLWKNILTSEEKTDIKIDKRQIKQFKKMVGNVPFESFDEIQKKYIEAEDKVFDNEDLLNRFKNENLDLVEEISDKVKSLEQKMYK